MLNNAAEQRQFERLMEAAQIANQLMIARWKGYETVEMDGRLVSAVTGFAVTRANTQRHGKLALVGHNRSGVQCVPRGLHRDSDERGVLDGRDVQPDHGDTGERVDVHG